MELDPCKSLTHGCHGNWDGNKQAQYDRQRFYNITASHSIPWTIMKPATFPLAAEAANNDDGNDDDKTTCLVLLELQVGTKVEDK